MVFHNHIGVFRRKTDNNNGNPRQGGLPQIWYNRSLSNYYASGNDIKLYSQAKKMSDSELRNIINRRNLERQYVQAMQDPVTQRGYDRVDLVLRALSTGAAVAGASKTIYSAGRTIYKKVHNKLFFLIWSRRKRII